MSAHKLERLKPLPSPWPLVTAFDSLPTSMMAEEDPGAKVRQIGMALMALCFSTVVIVLLLSLTPTEPYWKVKYFGPPMPLPAAAEQLNSISVLEVPHENKLIGRYGEGDGDLRPKERTEGRRKRREEYLLLTSDE